MKKILYTLAAATILLTACNKDKGVPEASNNVPVQFSTAITKAAGLEWGDEDQIGVFMMNNGTPLTTTRLADNVLYANSISGFTLASPIYYPQSQAVDFVAYHPYRATPESEPYIYKVVLGNQGSPQTFDLLYSNEAKNRTRSTSAVRLTFVHKLSKVVLNIKKSTGVTDLAGLAVKITGMPTNANFKLADGGFETPTEVANITPISITPPLGYDATYSAIVIPQEAGATGRKLVFTLGADTYEYAIPNTDNFESVKSHSYNITIKKSGITVSPGEITDWTGTGSSTDLGEGIPQEITKNGIKMVYIPKGTFLMGSPNTDEQSYSDEKPQHWVRLTKDFYMSKCQITNAQYAAFLNAKGIGSNGNWAGVIEGAIHPKLISTHSWGVQWDGTNKWEPVTGKENFPVINVTWWGAKAFADWIGGSLPTEAQWEYACRAGSTTPYSFGTNSIDDYAWYQGNSDAKTHEVGTMLPNAWGLYDMHGNVYEWCLDQWDGSNNYPTTATTEADAVENPLVSTGSFRVLRGGSWNRSARYCRSAYRSSSNPDYAYDSFGFRVVLVP